MRGRLYEIRPRQVLARTLYLPNELSHHPDGYWRIMVNNVSTYQRIGNDVIDSLEMAFYLLMERAGEEVVYGGEPHGPTPWIDTSMIGPQIGGYSRYSNFRVQVKVAQSLRHRQVAVDQLNQLWLDRTLCIGA